MSCSVIGTDVGAGARSRSIAAEVMGMGCIYTPTPFFLWPSRLTKF